MSALDAAERDAMQIDAPADERAAFLALIAELRELDARLDALDADAELTSAGMASHGTPAERVLRLSNQAQALRALMKSEGA